MLIDDESKGTPLARGQRLRQLRESLGLSRSNFGKLFTPTIPGGTIQTWEDARHGGITEKGARKISKGFQSRGLHCQLEWLLYGIGQNPLANFPLLSRLTMPHLEPQEKESAEITSAREKNHIIQELQLFHQHYVNAVDAIVPDDAMLPGLCAGDYVAGQRYFEQELDKALDMFCIIQLRDGSTVIRLLQKDSQHNRYNLVAINPHTTVENSVIYDAKLFSVAPITWIRRQNYCYLPLQNAQKTWATRSIKTEAEETGLVEL